MDAAQLSTSQAEQPANPPAGEHWGLGGNSKDARLVARALKEHWPISAEMKEQAIAVLVRVMSDPNAPTRDRVTAVKALVAANGQNIQAAQEQPTSAANTSIGQMIVQIVAAERGRGELPPG